MPSPRDIAKRQLTLTTHRIHTLPVVALMPHSRCNCRCVMCDIWKANRNGYVVLFGAANLLLIGMIFSPLLDAAAVFHVLFAATFLAYLTELATQLYHYRQGL